MFKSPRPFSLLDLGRATLNLVDPGSGVIFSETSGRKNRCRCRCRQEKPPFREREEAPLGDFPKDRLRGEKEPPEPENDGLIVLDARFKNGISRLPTRFLVCQPKNGRCAFERLKRGDRLKKRVRVFRPVAKRPAIQGLIQSRPFVTATDVKIGSVGGKLRSSRASSETSPRERTFVSSIPRPKARPFARTHAPRPATPSRVAPRPPSAAAKKPNATFG